MWDRRCCGDEPAARKTVDATQKQPVQRDYQETIMPILFYIAMWSCALGMASSSMPRRAPDSDDRW